MIIKYCLNTAKGLEKGQENDETGKRQSFGNKMKYKVRDISTSDKKGVANSQQNNKQ